MSWWIDEKVEVYGLMNWWSFEKLMNWWKSEIVWFDELMNWWKKLMNWWTSEGVWLRLMKKVDELMKKWIVWFDELMNLTVSPRRFEWCAWFILKPSRTKVIWILPNFIAYITGVANLVWYWRSGQSAFQGLDELMKKWRCVVDELMNKVDELMKKWRCVVL